MAPDVEKAVSGAGKMAGVPAVYKEKVKNLKKYMMMKKIAVPVMQGKVALHFGHCQEFYLYQVDQSEIVRQETLTPPPHQPGIIPKWLHQQDITDVIAGGMGQRAIDIFNDLGINVFVGAPSKEAATIVKDFLNGNLETQANLCDH